MNAEEKTTSQLLAERLTKALEGHSLSEVAEACGVSRQAVNGWKKDGRIDKAHLLTLSRITGKPLEFFLGGNQLSVDTDPNEGKILLLFRALPEEKQLQLLDHAQSLYSKQYGGYRPSSLSVHETPAPYGTEKLPHPR